MLMDYTIPSLAHVLRNSPTKRQGLMSLMYSFTDAQAPAHTACIKRLQLITGHLDIFVECLSSLIELESDFDDTLLDVYVYYATIGLGSACNRTRAAALRILAHLDRKSTRLNSSH